MTMNKKLMQATLASVVTAGLSLTANQTLAAKAPKMENCYGVAKAGKNDCSTKTHACGGLAKVDNDPNEWISVPQGTCVSLHGGSLQPGGKSAGKQNAVNTATASKSATAPTATEK